nr:MAG TPA: hypothetical protein [Caudoviricetes sp.]
MKKCCRFYYIILAIMDAIKLMIKHIMDRYLSLFS